tara:strand:- start:7007 stop:7600 length:594 start_codon:yes stop_codon:yes gene_type:complete
MNDNQVITNGQVKIGTAAGLAVAGGEQAPIADANERSGWLFTKAAADSTKFNYFFYGQGILPIRLSQLNHVYFNGAVDSYVDASSIPFIVVYTKPTGSGDAGAWYHSKIVYTMSDKHNLQLGEMVTFYTHTKPSVNYGYTYIPLDVIITDGNAGEHEEILYITVHSDSAAAMGTQILISDVGFETSTHISRKIKLIS